MRQYDRPSHIRLTAATVVFGTSQRQSLEQLCCLAFDSGRRNGQPWLKLNDRHARFRPSLFSLASMSRTSPRHSSIAAIACSRPRRHRATFADCSWGGVCRIARSTFYQGGARLDYRLPFGEVVGRSGLYRASFLTSCRVLQSPLFLPLGGTQSPVSQRFPAHWRISEKPALRASA